MAMPIKPAPTLRGKEAKIFIKKAKKNESIKAPQDKVEKAVNIFCTIMKNQKASNF